MAVEIKQIKDNKELNIKVSDRFDFGVHQEFRKASELVTEKMKAVVVDLSMTDYVDSSALGMLLVLRDKIGENQQGVRIINAKPEVLNILKIANFDKLFTVV